MLDDGLVSGQHAPHHARRRAATTSRTSAARTAPGSTTLRQEGSAGKVRLRDGALLFFGNHVAVFRMASQIELEAIKAELVAPFGPVATASPALAVACDWLRRLAASEGELLIVGETGVGKEVYARAVHQASGREEGRFVAINCAAIPRELVESELFGYRQGAHSTAHQAKPGLIEEAEGGTLFLDEIGEMTAEAQIKLLRFLQDRELTPLGSTRPRRMDVRIVAATNRTAAGPGKGPAGCATTSWPASARRRSTCRRCATASRIWARSIAHFLGRASATCKFEQPAFRALCLHAWPLNVRELEKIISTAAVLTGGDKPIALRDLPEPIARVLSTPAAATGARRATAPSPTPAQLEELLRRYEGNVADVSRELGKHRAAVWRWIKKFGLDPQKFRRNE